MPNPALTLTTAMAFMHEHPELAMHISAVAGSLNTYAEQEGKGVNLTVSGLEATDMPLMVFAVIPKDLKDTDEYDYDPTIDHIIRELEKLRAVTRAKANAKAAKGQN